MIGGAILRVLKARGETDIVTRTHSELDLTDQAAVRDFMQAERPDVVIMAAARVGGIHANNTYPADVTRLLQLGTSCIYPLAVPQPMLSHINVGSGTDISIFELAQLVAKVTGYAGQIVTDPTKPDGTPRKLMDVGRLARMGWRAKIGIEDGIAETYRWFIDNQDKLRT